jgi:hypothetical protein
MKFLRSGSLGWAHDLKAAGSNPAQATSLFAQPKAPAAKPELFRLRVPKAAGSPDLPTSAARARHAMTMTSWRFVTQTDFSSDRSGSILTDPFSAG